MTVELPEMHGILQKYDIAEPQCGFHLLAGWEGLVDELIEDLVELGWDKDLHQVKEKFGGLRFYIGSQTAEIAARISEAETKSLVICGDCGTDCGPKPYRQYMVAMCMECKRNEPD